MILLKKSKLAIFIILLLTAVSCTKKKGPEKINANIVTFNTGADSYVRSIKADNDYLWVGTSLGVIQVDLTTNDLIKTYTIKDGLKNNYVFTIGVDKAGVKWFGTNAGGLTKFDGKNWKTYLPLHGLADYWVYDIAYADNGDMWVGTWYGVSHFQGDKITNYYVSDGLINEWVYGVGIDKSGAVWFGTEGGVSRFDGKTWKSWTNKDGLGAPNTLKLNESSNSGLGTRNRHNLNVLDNRGNETYNPNYVFCALVDRDDNKWFGTWGGGLAKFNGRIWTSYTTKDGLSGNIVYSVKEDKEGKLWIGTNGGLSVFDGENWGFLKKENGLLGNNIYAIEVDKDNNIWLGQSGGVVKLEFNVPVQKRIKKAEKPLLNLIDKDNKPQPVPLY